MEVVFERCAGIDVPKRTAGVCLITPGDRRQPVTETRTYGTTTAELLNLPDWLSASGCTNVGLEGTGDYWKPIRNLLEGPFAVWLLSAQHSKAVPGRKTDVKDAQWIAELLRHGLVRPSSIPPRRQRELPGAPWADDAPPDQLRAAARDAQQPRAEGSGKREYQARVRGFRCPGGIRARHARGHRRRHQRSGSTRRTGARPSTREARRPDTGAQRAGPAAPPLPPDGTAGADRRGRGDDRALR